MITTRVRRAAAMVFTLGIVSMAAACTVESGEEFDEITIEAPGAEALGVDQSTGSITPTRTATNDVEPEEAAVSKLLQTQGDEEVSSDKPHETASLIEECGGGPCGGGGTSSGGTSSGGTSSGGPYGSFFCPFGCNSVNCQTYQCHDVGFMSCSCRPW